MPGFLANVPLIIHRELHFMHDGNPAHFSLVAHRCLNEKLPGWWMIHDHLISIQWISTCGAI
jgi:hypothetical protein